MKTVTKICSVRAHIPTVWLVCWYAGMGWEGEMEESREEEESSRKFSFSLSLILHI